MTVHNHNLNIHYAMPDEIWNKLAELYTIMPHWYGFVHGCPQWYGQKNDGKRIEASVEPGGLQFYATLPQEEWDSWFALFKNNASTLLGYDVGEPEDGFEFPVYD